MPTDIDIASNALLLIGDNPISSFSEPGAGPTVAANIYAETYASVLSTHPWSFALKELKLSKLSAVPDKLTNYSSAFQMPADLIRLWAIFPFSDYVIIGPLLYSNQSELLARYVYKVDETSLPPHFVKALEYKLASEFAISITEDEKKASLYESKFRQKVSEARNVDSQGRPQESIVDSPFVGVRLSGFAGQSGAY
jgi:hypothetical protein